MATRRRHRGVDSVHSGTTTRGTAMNLVRWVGLAVSASGCGGAGSAGASSLQNHDGGGAPSGQPDLRGVITRDSDAGASHPGVAYSVTFRMTEFTVQPGTEVWKCQDFAAPFDGQ